MSTLYILLLFQGNIQDILSIGTHPIFSPIWIQFKTAKEKSIGDNKIRVHTVLHSSLSQSTFE